MQQMKNHAAPFLEREESSAAENEATYANGNSKNPVQGGRVNEDDRQERKNSRAPSFWNSKNEEMSKNQPDDDPRHTKNPGRGPEGGNPDLGIMTIRSREEQTTYANRDSKNPSRAGLGEAGGNEYKKSARSAGIVAQSDFGGAIVMPALGATGGG